MPSVSSISSSVTSPSDAKAIAIASSKHSTGACTESSYHPVMRRALLLLGLAGCDAGTPCTADLDSFCGRSGTHCVQTWTEAADASTWCTARGVTNARTALQTCIGYHVAVATVGTTDPPTTVWYFYDADGGLIGASRRDENFKIECLAGRSTFRSPDDCASSESPHCCRLDFGPELACKQDAAMPKVDASVD